MTRRLPVEETGAEKKEEGEGEGAEDAEVEDTAGRGRREGEPTVSAGDRETLDGNVTRDIPAEWVPMRKGCAEGTCVEERPEAKEEEEAEEEREKAFVEAGKSGVEAELWPGGANGLPNGADAGNDRVGEGSPVVWA